MKRDIEATFLRLRKQKNWYCSVYNINPRQFHWME